MGETDRTRHHIVPSIMPTASESLVNPSSIMDSEAAGQQAEGALQPEAPQAGAPQTDASQAAISVFEGMHFASYKYGAHDLQRVGVWVKDKTLLEPRKPAADATVKAEGTSKDPNAKPAAAEEAPAASPTNEASPTDEPPSKAEGAEPVVDTAAMEEDTAGNPTATPDKTVGSPSSDKVKDKDMTPSQLKPESSPDLESASKSDSSPKLEPPTKAEASPKAKPSPKDEPSPKEESSPKNEPLPKKQKQSQPKTEPSYSSTSDAYPGWWIIYIHGGAWRDPAITLESFLPSLKHLIGLKTALPVAGYASIDYRLSPHPSHPQDPDSTPETSLRAARHPDHLHDVCSAVDFLNSKFGFSHRYLLVGHSAGATLSFQLVMSALDRKERMLEQERLASHARLFSSQQPAERALKRKRSVGSEDGGNVGPGLHGEEGSYADRVQDKQRAIGLIGCDWQEEKVEAPAGGDGGGGDDAGAAAVDGDGDGHVHDDGDQELEDILSNATERDDSDDPAILKATPKSTRDDHNIYVPLPEGIVAIAGIYDFESYNTRHGGAFTEFLTAAFGPPGPGWAAASPAQYQGRFWDWWQRKSVVIGESLQDELVDGLETASMLRRLEREKIVYFANRCLKGSHDSLWQDGAQAAQLVVDALLMIHRCGRL